ncbi:MAG: hypothetical protein CME64_00605 [Halobacteriovoraceae bacterium]|nr:hypothetical protein [Halobacteriovoraceae bacterium]
MNKLILVILLTSGVINAQTVEVTTEQPPLMGKELLLSELEKLENSENVNFEEALSSMNEKINSYAVVRKKECMGEYSSLEITPEGERRILKNKLSKEEKKLCLLELIRLRKNFTNSLFNIRRKALVHQHKAQLQNLEKLRSETLQELDSVGAKLK